MSIAMLSRMNITTAAAKAAAKVVVRARDLLERRQLQAQPHRLWRF